MNKINNKAGIFFNAFAKTFDTLYENKRGPIMRLLDHYFRSDIEIRYLKTFESFKDLSNKSIIDIGCGSGVYLSKALEDGALSVAGIDPAEGMLMISEERLKKYKQENNYKLIKGLFPTTDVEGKYDHAIVMGVMDYVENPKEFLSKLKEVYTTSAVLSFPSYHWIRGPIRSIRYKIRNVPLYFYSEEKIISILKDCSIDDYLIEKIPGAGMDYFVTLK